VPYLSWDLVRESLSSCIVDRSVYSKCDSLPRFQIDVIDWLKLGLISRKNSEQ
jgi:hypothetical protein